MAEANATICPTWGARLRTLRKAARFSLRGLANAVDLDFTYLSRIECGAFPPPSADAIERIARAIGVDPFDLMRGSGAGKETKAELRAEVARLRTALVAARKALHGIAEAADDEHTAHLGAAAERALAASWAPGLPHTEEPS